MCFFLGSAGFLVSTPPGPGFFNGFYDPGTTDYSRTKSSV